MKFLYLFDQLEFDNEGQVCATDKVNLFQARSNFLYLLSKYNQMLLKEKKLPLPIFFKDALSGTMMEVEFGGDFEHAKGVVLKNCLPEVRTLSALSDKEIISQLSDKMTISDAKLAEKLRDSENIRESNYIITHFAGNLFDAIDRTLSRGISEANKSRVFKNMIAYNSLMNIAQSSDESLDTQEAILVALGSLANASQMNS